MKYSLLILAAGMGSRYGGLKQLDHFGPNGETIIEYSIYDAIQAGFNKFVFIVQDSFKYKMEEIFRSKFPNIEMHFIPQNLDDLPDQYPLPNARTKPWGTGQAIWTARKVIHGPFGVINGDDFYGKDAYIQLMDFFKHIQSVHRPYSIIGYHLENTLSENGSVNRGICKIVNQKLVGIVETLKIQRYAGGLIGYPNDKGEIHFLDSKTIVSMNMFGLHSNIFQTIEHLFIQFLQANLLDLKSEFYIPYVLDNIMNNRKIDIRVIETLSEWFGVTYKEDKDIVQSKINECIQSGYYPKNLSASFAQTVSIC